MGLYMRMSLARLDNDFNKVYAYIYDARCFMLLLEKERSNQQILC